MKFVDSHCHLDYPELSDDLEATLAHAKSAGVGHLLTISVDMDKTQHIQTIANSNPHIHATFGIHPHEAERTLKEHSLDELRKVLREEALKPKVVGYGETGLDYYYMHSPKAPQQESFQAHIEAALEVDLPLIIHTRDAEEDTIQFLKEFGKGKVRGLIHCFSGTEYLAREALDLGFYISVSGIITFNKAEAIREVIADVPLERLLIETDAPYLAPVPYRGKPNQPAYVVHTARKLAEIKDIPLEEVADVTTRNFYQLFSKIK